MQPIKTTNAMNPAPAKGIESFPTPVIDDVVIAEVVNAWKGDYQPLEYGTLWKDVSHAPNQGSFPEHKLVFQQPASEDGQWIKRIWVNDRVNQDSYNYAIKYSAGSQQHPIYIRNYVVPRETYTPLPDGTPDPLFPIALLVDEEAKRIEGELDSKYVSVTRVYETLPGPEVPTKRYNERGDLETVIVQTVPPNTPPHPDGLLVTQSQVVQEEMGKGVKTTSTVEYHALLRIKENKEGLLGETITTDDIVDPSTNPDALSQTIVSSVVEQFSATKARRRTTTASGPTSLAQKSNDGKLLGDVISTQSIVDPSTNPDAVSSSVLSSEVKQLDSGKAVKTNVSINSTPTLSGNQNEEGLLGNKQVVESIVAAGSTADALSQTVVSSSVEAIDSVRSKKTTITSNGPTILSGKEKKEGLLGETTVTESIVSAQTDADALSQTVVASSVKPIDLAKSKKTTITSTGPISLTQKSNDGKLLGDVISTQSIVDPSTNPDAVSSIIISSEVKQLDSGKAVKTNVVLNSTPTLSGNQNELGLLGSKLVTESIVPAGASADPLSTTVISSSVEAIDFARSKKTTITSTGPTTLSGNQKKEGLLGEISVTETIVAAGASADALSATIISSQVDPIDSAKSKKTTIESTGPTSLPSDSLVDSPLGLVLAHIEKQIVPAKETASNDPLINFKRVKDSISPIDSVKSERETVDVSEWPENVSVVGDEVIDIPIFYKETIESPTKYAEQGGNGYDPLSGSYDIKALDQWKGLLRRVDIDKFNESIKDKWYKLPSQIDINLPDILKSVKVYWGGSAGSGTDYDFGNGAFTGSYNRNQSGSSKSSYSINGDIHFDVQKGFSGGIPGFIHVFFLEASGLNFANILARLNELEATVSASPSVYSNWPYLQISKENLVLIGGSKSETKSESLSESVTINGFSSTTGSGRSFDVNVNVNSIIIPEALHDLIDIDEEFIGVPPSSNKALDITYGIRPFSLPKSRAILNGSQVECARFPTGNYLISATSELYKYGWAKITAKTANITDDYTKT